MLRIKLRRIGKKRQPSYRLVVAEKTARPQDQGIEDLGWFNPLQNKKEFNKERVLYWISKGALPTDTVHNLLVDAGILSESKVDVSKKAKKPKAEKAEAKPEAVAPATK